MNRGPLDVLEVYFSNLFQTSQSAAIIYWEATKRLFTLVLFRFSGRNKWSREAAKTADEPTDVTTFTQN